MESSSFSTSRSDRNHPQNNNNINNNISTAKLREAADELVRQYHYYYLRPPPQEPPTSMETDRNNETTTINLAFRQLLFTLLKLVQNVLKHSHPNQNHTMYTKVRRIPLYNPTIQQHVVQFPPRSSLPSSTTMIPPPGVAFLYACGFTKYSNSSNTNTSSSNSNSHHDPIISTTIGNAYEVENTLVLLPFQEDANHLRKAQQLLMDIAIYELHIPRHEIPITTTMTTTTTTMNTGTNEHPHSSSSSSTPPPPQSTFPGGFNPYQGYRIDITGINNSTATTTTGTSKIDLELQQLQHAKQTLLLQQQQVDAPKRSEWTMTILQPSPTTSSNNNNNHMEITHTSTTSTTATPSDGSLLAQRMQQQSVARMKRENGGLTTKAMRDLETLQQSKLYTHVALSIHVTMQYGHNDTSRSSENNNSNTLIVQFHGTFLPNDTIDTVMTALRNDCLVLPLLQSSSSSSDTTTTNNHIDFELYSTPPMITYNHTKRYNTLQQEQLVPASKLFLRWIVPSSPNRPPNKSSKMTSRTTTSTATTNPIHTEILQPKWLSMIESHLNKSSSSHSADATTAVVAFPKAIPIRSALPTTAALKDDEDPTATHPKKPTTTTTKKLSKEELLLRRMMGGK
jgi:hypothetical protein